MSFERMKGHGRGPELRRPIEREPSPAERQQAARAVADNMATLRADIERMLAEVSRASTAEQWQAARHAVDVGLHNLSDYVRSAASYEDAADQDAQRTFRDTTQAYDDLLARSRAHEQEPIFPEPALTCEEALLAALPATTMPGGPVAAYFQVAEIRVAGVLETVSRRETDAVTRRLQDPKDPLGNRFARFGRERQGKLLSFLRSRTRLLAVDMEIPRPRGSRPRPLGADASAPNPLDTPAPAETRDYGNAERAGPAATGESARDGQKQDGEQLAVAEPTTPALALPKPSGMHGAAAAPVGPAGTQARRPRPSPQIAGHGQADSVQLRAASAAQPGDASAAASDASVGSAASVHARAADGVAGTDGPLPHREAIQESFGRHDVAGIQAHVGGRAAAATADLGAHAYATGNQVAFAGSPDLHTAAHEAAHVIQQRGGVQLKGGVGQAGDAYEQHADRVADQVVRGESAESLLDEMAGGSRGDGLQLRGGGAALQLDRGGPAAVPTPEDQALAHPPPAAMSVQFSCLLFTPAPGTKWIAGIDKVLVANAITVKALVADAAYSPGLARQTDRFIRSVDGFASTVSGRATQDEEMGEFRVGASLALDFLMFLRDAKKLALTLSQERIDKLLLGRDIRDAWHFIKAAEPPLPAWYGQDLFWDQILAEEHKPLILDFRAKVAAYDTAKNAATREALKASLNALLVPLRPDIQLVERVRQDPSLTDHPSYRQLWRLPAVDPARPRTAPTGANAAVDAEMAARLLQQARTNTSAGGQAREDGPAGSKARRTLLDGMLVVADELDAKKEGDTPEDAELRSAASRANAPPVPSTMSAYPSLPPPFTRPVGSTHTFVMSLQYPTGTLEGLGAQFENQYKWELIRIPDDDFGRLGEVAKDQRAKGHRPSFGDLAGQAAARQRSYLDADLKRVQGALEGVEVALGPMHGGATTLVAASRALGVVGQVVNTAIHKAFEPDNENTVALNREPGLYVVRCTVDRPVGDGAQFVRAPSVAWHAVFVHPPQTVSEMALESQLRGRAASDERLRQIEADLADDKLSPEARAALEEEGADLRIALYGSVEGVLVAEQDNLEKRRRALHGQRKAGGGKRDESQAYELEHIDKRLDEIAEVLKVRRVRHEEHLVPGLEGPVRVPAAFVGDDGKTLSLVLEAMEQPKQDGKFVYHVTDATTKDSSQATVDPPQISRADAIAGAIKQLLERASGYGRGHVTIHVPAPGGAIASLAEGADARPHMRTIEIKADLTAIAMEGIDNVATALSVAAVVAAPFTGGASLVLLLPIGAVGAIPSAYRLADRAAAGTLRMDLASAMDVVNIVGSVVGIGQMTNAGLKSVRVSGGLMMIGLGSDGLGIALAGAQFIEGARNIDPNAPPGVRQAMLMELVAQQLLDAGIQAGTGLARRAQEQRARHAGAGGDAGLRRGADDLQQRFHAAARTETPIFEDPSLRPNTAQVRFDLDGYGLVTNVRVAMAPGTAPDAVLTHASAVETIGKFEPTQSLLRNLLDRVTVLSRGADAADAAPGDLDQQIHQLPARLRELQQKAAEGKLSPREAESAAAELVRQMERHERALDDLAAGGRNEADRGGGTTLVPAPMSPAPPDVDSDARGTERNPPPREVGAETSRTPPQQAVLDEADRLRAKDIVSVPEARRLRERAQAAGVPLDSLPRASTPEQILKAKGMTDLEIELYKQTLNKSQQASMTDEEKASYERTAGKTIKDSASKDALGRTRDAATPEQIQAALKANIILFDELQAGVPLTKIIPEAQVGGFLVGETVDSSGRSRKMTRMAGDISPAANTEGMTAEEKVRFLGLDYDENTYVERKPDGTVEVKESCKRRLYEIEQAATHEQVESAKVPMGRDLYRAALLEARRLKREGQTPPKLLELDTTGELLHVVERNRNHGNDPSAGFGYSASMILRNDRGEQHFRPNQELNADLKDLKPGAELIEIDDRGERKVVARFDGTRFVPVADLSAADAARLTAMEQKQRQENDTNRAAATGP